MARILGVALGLALCMAVAFAADPSVAEIVLQNMDPNVSPCADFYNYSCGGWLGTHQIPGDKSRIDRSFEVITEYNSALLQEIANDPSSGLVYKYFNACMDTAAIDQVDAAPVRSVWNDLDSLNNGNDGPAQINGLALLLRSGFSALYNFGSGTDAANPGTVIYTFNQGGLSLPDRSYYTDASIFAQYKTHIETMLSMMSSGSASDDAARIANFEAAIANITVPADQLFDPFKSFNRMSWSDLKKLAPNLGFDLLINRLGLNEDVAVALDAPVFFSALSNLVSHTDHRTLSAYYKWAVLHQSASRLSSRFVKENFKFFGTVLSGTTTPSPRSKTCMAATDAAIPELTGKLYAQKAFPASSKDAAEQMFDAIVSSFEINVQKLDWMDPQTLQRALDKLGKIKRLIGYPENPRSYSEFSFNAGYSANWNAVAQDDFKRTMAAAGGKSDRTQWLMSADTVNAYYEPTSNDICVPAGIMQSPFFDAAYPAPMNYGGIGMVVGHELTHSLDSQGRDYNGEGKLEDWWTPSTSTAFQKRVDCIIQQYSKFSPLPGYFVNGKLTQGENIADAGGLKTAHSAYLNNYPNDFNQPSIVPGLSNEQLFFVGFAQSWCSKLTPNAIKQRILTDPHSPPRFRVNGAAMNLPAFAQAFNCPANTAMNPSDRCQIW